MKDDFFYICDYCEQDTNGVVVVWKKLPKRQGHFAICFNCIRKLYIKNISDIDKADEKITLKRRALTEQEREEIFEKYNSRCVKCGSDKRLEIDHIIPFKHGGNTKLDNLQLLCKKCNSYKRDKF